MEGNMSQQNEAVSASTARSDKARGADRGTDPASVELPETDCLRLENLALKKALKQRELLEIENMEIALHREIMARLDIEGAYEVDLQARRAIRKVLSGV
jgi:hypothetical protein